MRLIDADTVDRDIKMHMLRSLIFNRKSKERLEEAKRIRSIIIRARSVNLVQCGECIYAREQDGFYECDYSTIVRDPEGYCDTGARKEAENVDIVVERECE